jgi:hypothetical protein
MCGQGITEQWGRGLGRGVATQVYLNKYLFPSFLFFPVVVFVSSLLWPMGPGLAHWVAKQLLFRG